MEWATLRYTPTPYLSLAAGSSTKERKHSTQLGSKLMIATRQQVTDN